MKKESSFDRAARRAVAQTVNEVAPGKDAAVRKELEEMLYEVKELDADAKVNYKAALFSLKAQWKEWDTANKKLWTRYDRIGSSTNENTDLEEKIETVFESLDNYVEAFDQAVNSLASL